MANKAFIVTDLSYGDAGKGSTVDYLARQYDTSVVVRFNGASQAAHNVITPDGVHHVFSQFGSGSFSNGSKTFLSKYMLINPLNMLNEASHLIYLGMHDIWERTYIDRNCIVIMPWHEATNRIKEVLRNKNRHGSCGHGLGEAVSDNQTHPELTIRVNDLQNNNPKSLIEKIIDIRNKKYNELKDLESIYNCKIEALYSELFASNVYIENLISKYNEWVSKINIVATHALVDISSSVETIIFEGSQGVLLDENWGFHPHTTWSNTTSDNAFEIVDDIGFDSEVIKLGLIRAYTTRHGAGPFVTQDNSLNDYIIEKHNSVGSFQGTFRKGWLDLVAHKYAIEANGGIDALVISGLDQISEIENIKVCTSYSLPEEIIALKMFQRVHKYGHEIRLGDKYDLNSREKLTITLNSAVPNYQEFSISQHQSQSIREESILGLISDRLDSKILLKSYGPSATNKTIVC